MAHHVTVAGRPVTAVLSRRVATVLYLLLGVLLVEVLFEGWIQVRFGDRGVLPDGAIVVELQTWPKVLKNALYMILAALTALKITVDGRWREFRTRADLALVVLVLVLVLAGLVGGSSATLIGEALFVYFRGAVVFYVWRALDPTRLQIRRLLTVLGVIVGLNVVIAIVEMLGGVAVYSALGWTDLKWARTNRAHALLTHPNHLGHVLSLTILFIVSWMMCRKRLDWRWWAVLSVVVLALSATQSRESVIAVSVTCILVWLLAREHLRRVVLVVVIIGVGSVAQVALRPSNLAEWQRRLVGVVDAFRVPSGSEPGAQPVPSASVSPVALPQAAPPREIRVLFYQQGLRLWANRPILGYGVGQFGGIVAHENDPNWHLNPKFGAGGFNRYGFRSVQVDSFWLHLTVEAGALGLAAYLVWLFFLILPLLQRTPRWPSPRIRGRGDHDMALTYWGIGAVIFAVQVGFLSASLEDPLLPPLLFTCVGLAWLMRPPAPATAPSAPGPDPLARSRTGALT